MSLRPPVDQQRIEHFLQQLGKNFHCPGRIYLVGGTSLVYEGWRHQTLDIDLTFDIKSEHHTAFISTVRNLKEKLALNIEEVSPAHFIPLPKGYQERSQFINRYGQLEVFHFDLYSTALSKISRGTEEDFSDVLALLQVHKLELSKLKNYFAEILPLYAKDSVKQDPVDFERKFNYLVQIASNRDEI